MCLRLNHTPTYTQPQTPDIPTNPETFGCLTSSYHTLLLRFDLPLSHVIPQCYHVESPMHVFRFEEICFLSACDEFARPAVWDANSQDI